MLVADMLIFFLKGLLTCLLSYENCYDYIFMDVVRSQFTTDKQLSDLSVWQVNIIHAFENSLEKKEGRIDADKMAVLNGWRRVGSNTREALRRSSLFELIEGYEVYT